MAKKATVKKRTVKKSVEKKATPKKSLAKKSAVKKVAKKTAVKKKAPKKAVAKKAASKKSLVKKSAAKRIAAVKKPLAKKAIIKKITPAQKITAAKKPAVKKAIVKQMPPLKKATPKVAVAEPVHEQLTLFTEQLPAAHIDIPLPSITALPEDLVSKAANIKTTVPVAEKTPGQQANAAKATEDPLTAFDKHVFEKATAKGDPQSKLRLSSVNKSSIKPSGKKPLWNK
jgi:Histone H1-like nucleoprotein HC2